MIRVPRIRRQYRDAIVEIMFPPSVYSPVIAGRTGGGGGGGEKMVAIVKTLLWWRKLARPDPPYPRFSNPPPNFGGG